MMQFSFIYFVIFQLPGWSLFEDVKFRTAYNEQLEAYIDVPKFGRELQDRQGSTVRIKGYYLPLELKAESTIILSRYPYASCFFCGGAGLESVIEVQFARPQRQFKPDEVITVKGTLRLNKDDVEHLAFVLENAQTLIWED